jgi:hypothetical protein
MSSHLLLVELPGDRRRWCRVLAPSVEHAAALVCRRFPSAVAVHAGQSAPSSSGQ